MRDISGEVSFGWSQGKNWKNDRTKAVFRIGISEADLLDQPKVQGLPRTAFEEQSGRISGRRSGWLGAWYGVRQERGLYP